MREIAEILRNHFGQYGYPIPRSEAKFCLVKFIGIFRNDARKIAAYWGREMAIDNSQSKDVLGIEYRPISDTMKEMVESMIAKGMIEDRMTK